MSNTKLPTTRTADTAVVVTETPTGTENTQVVSPSEREQNLHLEGAVAGEVSAVEVIGGTERLAIPLYDENDFGVGGTFVLNEDGTRTRVAE